MKSPKFLFMTAIAIVSLYSCNKDVIDNKPLPDNSTSGDIVTISGNPSQWVSGNQIQAGSKSYKDLQSVLDKASLIYSSVDASTTNDQISFMNQAYTDMRTMLLDIKGNEGQKKVKEISGFSVGDGLYLLKRDNEGTYKISIFQVHNGTENFVPKTLVKTSSGAEKLGAYEDYIKKHFTPEVKEAALKAGFTEAQLDSLKNATKSEAKWDEIKARLYSLFGKENVIYSQGDNKAPINMNASIKEMINKKLSETTASNNALKSGDIDIRKAPTIEYHAYCYITDHDQIVNENPPTRDYSHIRFIVQTSWVARLIKLQNYGNNNVIEFYNQGPGTLATINQRYYGNWFSWVNNVVSNVPSDIVYYIDPKSPVSKQLRLADYAPKTIPPKTKIVNDKTSFGITISRGGPAFSFNIGRDVTYKQENADTNTDVNPVNSGVQWKHDYDKFAYPNDPIRENSFFKQDVIGATQPWQYNGMMPINELPEIFRKHWTLSHSAIYEIDKDVKDVRIAAGIRFKISNLTATYTGAFWQLNHFGAFQTPVIDSKNFDMNMLMDVNWSKVKDI